MSKLKFIIDQEYDSRMIFVMLRNHSDTGLKYQAQSMEINLELAQKISKGTDYDQVKTDIDRVVDQRYGKLLDKMNEAKDSYQKSWDKINDEFFNRLAEITDFPVQHEVFECVISAFHIGISNWGGYKIVRRFNFDHNKQRRITAHEIIISHFFSLMRSKHPNTLTDQQIWQLAEIFAFIITGLDQVMTSFWPGDKSGSYTDYNYPEIADLQVKLTKIYQKEGFESFIKQGTKSFSK